MGSSLLGGGSSIDNRSPKQKELDHIKTMINYHTVRRDIERAAEESEKVWYHSEHLKTWQEQLEAFSEFSDDTEENSVGCIWLIIIFIIVMMFMFI